MDTLSLTLDVAGGHFLCTLPKSTAIVRLLGFAIQQHREHTLRSGVSMLLDILAYTFNWLDIAFECVVLIV